MEIWQRSRLINRIVSGQTRIIVDNKVFYVRRPSRIQRCMGDDIFFEWLDATEEQSETSLRELLVERSIWSEDQENLLSRFGDDIDNIKVELFKKRFRSFDVAQLRGFLQLSREKYNELVSLKHSYDLFSCLGLAQAAKDRFLLGCSTFYEDETPYWSNPKDYDKPDEFLNKISAKLREEIIEVEDFRELARTEPWLSFWNIQKYCQEKIFGGAPIDLTDDQRSLIIWSSIYESIREHPDVLTKDVIEDNDMLDGWLLIKQRDKETGQKTETDGLTSNKKIREATEQFYMVNTPDDAKRLMQTHNTEETLLKMNKHFGTLHGN